MLDTICAWYGWEWKVAKSHDTPNTLNLSYDMPPGAERTVHIPETFPINQIGKPNTQPVWGEFLGIPNPCKNDPIAGIFYLLTCAEEYSVAQKDKHGRVSASDLSYVQRGYAGIPLADRLVEVLAKAVWNAAGFNGSPTMKTEAGYSSLDIDQVYAVQGKSLYKQIGNLGRETLSRGFAAGQAVAIGLVRGKDPFDQFEWLQAQHEMRGLRPYIFVLMGYENQLDQAWKPGHHAWPSFIQRLKGWSYLGIHPSYHTSQDDALLKAEKLRLEELIGTSVNRSRQHYLKVAWPKTFQSLLASGVSEDYTLAWADCLGFRMGTARSCYWYDLTRDVKTTLRLYPPTIMEVTGRFYMKLSPKQFLQAATDLKGEANKSNSNLRIIWHNSSLSAVGGWAEWRVLYLKILDLLT